MGKRIAVFGEDRVILTLLGEMGVVVDGSCRADEFDALVITSEGTPQSLILDFYKNERPIAAFGAAVSHLARYIPRVTVCKGTQELPGVHYEDCAEDDFVSDRENRVVTAPWPVASALRELVEMA